MLATVQYRGSNIMLGDPLFWMLVLPGLLLGAYAQGHPDSPEAKRKLQVPETVMKPEVVQPENAVPPRAVPQARPTGKAKGKTRAQTQPKLKTKGKG